MSLQLPEWVCGEDLAQLSEADRVQVLDWLRECGVNPDRTRAIRLDGSESAIVAQEYVQWPITVGRRGIELRTETYVMVGDVPSPLATRPMTSK